MSNPRLLLRRNLAGAGAGGHQDIYAALPGIKAEGTSVLVVGERDVGQAMKVASTASTASRKPRVPRHRPPVTQGTDFRAPLLRRLGERRDGWIDTLVQGYCAAGRAVIRCSPPGLALSFGVMRMINIAHGDFCTTTAAFAAIAIVDRWASTPSWCCSSHRAADGPVRLPAAAR